MNGLEDGVALRSILPSGLAFLRSSKSPHRMKSFSLNSASLSGYLRRLVLLLVSSFLSVSYIQFGLSFCFRTYSTASILSRCTASFPDTKSFIRSLGCPGGAGFASSTRRQNRHSQLRRERRRRWLAFPFTTDSSSSSLSPNPSLSQSERTAYSGLYGTAKSSSFGGKKSTTRTVAR